MRIFWNAAISLVLVLASVVGPVSAATAPSAIVGQASQQIVVSGQVQNQGGSPLGQSNVTIQGNGVNKTVTTDATGAFSFSVAPGLYTINVNHGGYQSASNDVTVVDVPLTVNVQLVTATSDNLTVIGKTTAASTNNTAKFNISSSAQSSLNQAQIVDRDTPNLSPLLNELPGININHSSSNPNQYVLVHGFGVETKAELDGHPVSSGTGGTFLTQFMQAGIFGGVDVAEGFGLNGATAGQSGIGTVNLRTPDFSPKDSAFLQGGFDSYNGSFYSVVVDKNFLNNRLHVILGRGLTGYNGPTFGSYQNAIASGGAFVNNDLTYTPPALNANLIAFQGDFSNSFNLNAELAKVKYDLSSATSITGEFIGFQGRWDPQGGAYGQLEGYTGPNGLPQCLNGTTAGSGAACTNLSAYNAPSAQSLVGQSNLPIYTFYPGSDVRQNQPNFSAEFKTTFHDDTILFRPYAAGIRRLIDGTNESGTPGDNGAWYQVTNPANCTVAFQSPNAANGGAKGPCYIAGGSPNAPGFVVDPNTPHNFTTNPISALPAGQCTVANPCYTNATVQNNAGFYGFGAPYTTLEIDKLAGYTFTYIHPFGDNVFNLSVDHYYDDAAAFVNDYSPLVAGCSFIASGSALPVLASGLGSQPGCAGFNAGTTAAGVTTLQYRPSPISIPETFSSITDISATLQFQLRPNLEFDFGNYLTHYVINGQQLNPVLIAQYEAAGINTAYIPVPQGLVGVQNSHSHYDPHLGFVFRPTRDLAIRVNGGSSISIPYAGQISGFTTAAQGAASTTITSPNAGLLPEEAVGEDVGLSYRFKGGAVLSVDGFNTIVHNPWISSKVVLANGPLPGLEPTQITYASQTLNGSQKNSRGIDFQFTNEPYQGFGYRLTSSIDSVTYSNQPASLFVSPQTYFNGAQVPGIPVFRSYGELRFAGPRGSLLRLGADYEGANNEFNAPPFVQFDAGAQVSVGGGFLLKISGENITNVNLNTALGAGIAFQGNVPLAQSINQTTGAVTAGNGSNVGVVNPGFRTFRLSLEKRF